MNPTVLTLQNPNDRDRRADGAAISLLRRLSAAEMISPSQVQLLVDEECVASIDSCVNELVRRSLLTQFQGKVIRRTGFDSLVFGRYHLLDEIGRGGSGRVFKVRHHGLKRVAALKLLARKNSGHPEFLRRFSREAVAAARLDHPNITKAFDAGYLQRRPYLVMEYVEGQDLSSLVTSGGPLPVSSAIDFILQAARGLQYAHSQGVLHRDIKPANLIVDARGTVKITDFGLARFLPGDDEVGQSELTREGVGMGTVDFVAPEQSIDARCVDGRADIYSLGATLFFLLRGFPMYQGSIVDRLLAHRHQPVPSLFTELADATTALQALFRRMVAKNPSDRVPTFGEVVRELERCQQIVEQPRPTQSESHVDECERLTTFLQNLEQSQTAADSVRSGELGKRAARLSSKSERSKSLEAGQASRGQASRESASSTCLAFWQSRFWRRLFRRQDVKVAPKRRQGRTVIQVGCDNRTISRA